MTKKSQKVKKLTFCRVVETPRVELLKDQSTGQVGVGFELEIGPNFTRA